MPNIRNPNNQITSMKKLICFFSLLLTGILSFAQFHFEAGINGNVPYGTLDAAHDLGIGVFVESKYALNEKVDVGFFYGRNAFLGINVEDDSYGVSTVNPLLATLTYKKQNEDIAPYFGVGVGVYQVNSLLEIGSGVKDPFLKTTEFGFSTKAGIYLHFVYLGLAYHFSPRAQYLQVHLGIRFLHEN